MSKNQHANIELEESSGNVLADLGLENADELFTRSRLGFYVYRILISSFPEKMHNRRLMHTVSVAAAA